MEQMILEFYDGSMQILSLNFIVEYLLIFAISATDNGRAARKVAV